MSHCPVTPKGKKKEEGGPTWHGWDFLCALGWIQGLWLAGETAVRARGGSGFSKDHRISPWGWEGHPEATYSRQVTLTSSPAYVLGSTCPASVFPLLVLDHVNQRLSPRASAHAVNSPPIASCLGRADSNLSFSSQLRCHLLGEAFSLPITFHPLPSN